MNKNDKKRRFLAKKNFKFNIYVICKAYFASETVQTSRFQIPKLYPKTLKTLKPYTRVYPKTYNPYYVRKP